MLLLRLRLRLRLRLMQWLVQAVVVVETQSHHLLLLDLLGLAALLGGFEQERGEARVFV